MINNRQRPGSQKLGAFLTKPPERNSGGKKREFLKKPESNELVDAGTGSTWDFSGKATWGELSGSQLVKLTAIKDYWFDWKTYNPNTELYLLGER